MDKPYVIYLGADGLYHAKFTQPIAGKVGNLINVSSRDFAGFLADTLVKNIGRTVPPRATEDKEQGDLFPVTVLVEETAAKKEAA